MGWESLLEAIRQNIDGWYQQTFQNKKFVDNAFTSQAHCPKFEFSNKVMGSNPGYLLKSFLLYKNLVLTYLVTFHFVGSSISYCCVFFMDDDFVPAAYFKAFCTWIVVWRAWNSTVTSSTDKWDFFFPTFSCSKVPSKMGAKSFWNVWK